MQIKGLTIYSDNKILKNASINIEGETLGKINKRCKDKEIYEFPRNYHLLPGFIDMHIHGANNADVMDGTIEALQTIANTLPAEGTTAFLATTMSESIHKIDQAVSTVAQYMQQPAKQGAEILGLHLEGPFISPRRAGAQDAKYIIPADIDLFQHWQQLALQQIKLVTIAPEIDNGITFIKYLREKNIIASFGHSDADYQQCLSGIEAGCTHVTHMYNAMRGMSHRDPGPLPALLMNPHIIAELITDGIHLHPEIVNMTYQIKGKESLVLVTDAMRAKCCGEGIFDLGGQPVHVHGNEARLADGTIAGSVLSMQQAIQNMLHFTMATLQDVMYLTSINPAKQLNCFDRKGSITCGKDADLVVLDDQYQVVMTICRGQIVYAK